jgi:tetratricopeptide (TPR) repeat protein
MRGRLIAFFCILLICNNSILLFGQTSNGVDIATQADELYKKAKYAKAETMINTTLAAFEVEEGARPPEQGQGALLNVLAKVYYKRGQFAIADSLFQLALSVQEKAFGEFSPACINILNDRGQMLIEMSRFDEALEMLAKSQVISKNEFGITSIEYGRSIALFANCLVFMGLQAKAQGYLNEAETIFVRV